MSQKFPFKNFLKNSIDNNDFKKNVNLFGEDIQNDLLFKTSNNNEKQDSKEQETDNSSDDNSEFFSPEELNDINQEVLNYLKRNINAQKFQAYFDNFFIVNVTSDTIEFTVSTLFIKKIISSQYMTQIQEAINDILGKDYNVQINVKKTIGSLSSNKNNILDSINSKKALAFNNDKTVEEEDTANNAPKFSFNLTPSKSDLLDKVDSEYIKHMNPIQTGMLIDTEKTFDCYIVGPSNNLACATAKAAAQNPGKAGKYPSLYFYGNSGLGKTHLLHATANEITNHFPSLVICMITARDFMKEMIDGIQNNNLSDFQKKYSEDIDVLMIDDIQELKNKTGTQNELFHIFNALYTKGKQLIFTSDKPPNEIDGLEERIKTRLQWGLVVDIQMPDLETRIAILKKKANALDIYLSDDIINLIAQSIKSSIRELEGALIKLSAYTDLMKTEIDIDMVKELLEIKANRPSKELTMETISKSVAKHFKIPLVDLKSAARTKELTIARHAAMYLSKKVMDAPYSEIGIYFGGRDHSSILHGVNKIKDQLEVDISLVQKINAIEKSLISSEQNN